jgi:hypothetical protein
LDWTLVFNMSVDEIPYTLARFANELKANTSWVQI